jgi:hypothetical protein
MEWYGEMNSKDLYCLVSLYFTHLIDKNNVVKNFSSGITIHNSMIDCVKSLQEICSKEKVLKHNFCILKFKYIDDRRYHIKVLEIFKDKKLDKIKLLM